MRLTALHPQPYGALPDARLEFGNGLTVVHGLNEAGKSTLLSAYVDLLCGIPPRTSMAFLVDRARLRIKAAITMDDGSTVEVIRTSKKAPNDLLDAATSRPVPDELRQRLSPAIDRDMLLRQFGLDHDRLVAGGRSLMTGRGELADVIFETRSGTDVRALVDKLENRAGALYKTRKNSPSELAHAHKRRAELDDDLKVKMATAEAVKDADTKRQQAEAELGRARLAAERLREEHTRLSDLARAWPYWEKYRARRDELELAVADGARLSSDQLKAVTEAVARLGAITEEINEQDQAIQNADVERSGLAVNEDLLKAQPAIDTLAADKHRADDARAQAAELDEDVAKARAAFSSVLRSLDIRDDTDPAAALVKIAIPDDRVADLNALAAEHDQLAEAIEQCRQSVKAADAAVQTARQAAEADDNPRGERPDTVDPSRARESRERRDALWDHVLGSWLHGETIAPEVGSGPQDLADKYQESVASADSAADELVAEAGRLSQQRRKAIKAAASAQATIKERRTALDKVKRALDESTAAQAGWQSRWQTAAELAGLPYGLGVAGWREHARLLAEAHTAAENLSELEAKRDAAIRIRAEWDTAAAALAGTVGQPIPLEQVVAWFDATKAAYDRSKSNLQAAEVHRKAQQEAITRISQLRDEGTALEESLDAVANASGVDRGELTELISRTRNYLKAEDALKGPEGELRATHPGLTLGELEGQLAERNCEQLKVDIESAQEALEQANKTVEAAHAAAIATKSTLAELKGRAGADVLRQELSQATARVLDVIEDYATTRLMHHLLTQELRVYLESHENPVLATAGSYLCRLTQGRFTELRAEGEGTERSLVVVGADDADYDSARLSEGTASQLYLSLSLAGVLDVERERRRAGQETVPVLLDDVLMPFDDERAKSALDLLAEIATQQQIVLFTHHRAVKEQADAISRAVTVVSLAAPEGNRPH